MQTAFPESVLMGTLFGLMGLCFGAGLLCFRFLGGDIPLSLGLVLLRPSFAAQFVLSGNGSGRFLYAALPKEGKVVLDYLGRTHATTLLTDREKHLVGLAVTMTRGCQVCTRGRIEKAQAAGISDDVLNALVEIVSAVNAGVAAATAREGFRQAEASAVESCGALCAAETAVNR